MKRILGSMALAAALVAGVVGGSAATSEGATPTQSLKYFECQKLADHSPEQAACFQELQCANNLLIRSGWSDAQKAKYAAFLEATGFVDPCVPQPAS